MIKPCKVLPFSLSSFSFVITIIVALQLFTTGCDTKKFFDQSTSVPGDKWPADKEMVFTIDITDTISPYSFFINVRNSTSYRYNNIYFFLETEFPTGGMSRDTIELRLADKEGNWLGRGTGKYKDNRVFIRDNIRFPQKGIYTLRLNQAMREETLEGISEAGIRLEKQ